MSTEIEKGEKKTTENNKGRIQTAEELLSTITMNVFEYYEKHKNSLKGRSLVDIFFAYVENNNDIIQQVETKLGKELSFNDIKNLYLQTHYTLEEGLTKDIFKNFKQKEAVKSVIRVFQNKIQEEGINIDFNQFLQTEINSNEDIDNLFKQIKDYLDNEFKSLSSEDKEKIKNTKIINEDIITQLVNDGIITNIDYLKENINELRQETNEEMQNILNIHSTLLNANIINNINDVNKGFEQFQRDLFRITGLGKFSDILEKYDINKISQNEIDAIFNLLNLDKEVETESIDTENTYENRFNEIKKRKVLKELSEDHNLYIDFIANHEKENNEKGLSEILKKTIENQQLSENEKSFVINNLFKSAYIENISRIVSNSFNLTEEQDSIYKKILSQLLDPSNDLLNLPNSINIGIKKELILPEASTIYELFEMEPVIKFEIVGDNVNYFKNIYPNYFTNIDSKNYSIFTQVKVKDNDGNEYTGYIQEGLEQDTIEIYGQNPIDNDVEIITTLNTTEIEKIEKLEQDKLMLDSRSDLRKFAVGMVSYFPDKKKDYNSYKFIETIDEEKGKEENGSENTNKNNDYEIDVEKFTKEWSKIEGDSNTRFEVGSVFQIRGTSLDYPGITSNWFYAEIININKETGYLKIKLNGGGLLNLDKEGEEIEIPMIAKWITKMKFEYGGNLFKFNKINNIEDFFNNLKDITLKSDFQGLQGGLSLWSNNIEVKDNKLVRKNEQGEYEEIKYIGNAPNTNINNLNEVRNSNKAINEKFNAWEIEVNGDYIILKYPYDKTFSRRLDFNTFLILITQNKLEPWTEKDFNSTEIDVSMNPNSNESRWKFFSFDNVMLSVKQLKENFSYYFKEDDELRAAEMYAKMAGTLPNWWFLSDIKMEASGEKESKLWKIIENAKSRLERTGEGKGQNHGRVAANIIEKEIFKKVKKGDKLSYRTRLKAAGYLMYALEKGPGPYFRGLANYEGQGYWVKALFGEEHYNKWQARNQNLQEQLKREPGNEAIRDELIKSEVFYMKELDESASMYTSNFGSTIEGLTINTVYSGGKVEDVYEGESGKGNYLLIRDGVKSYIHNNRPANSLGALKALSERVETYDNYIDYYKIVSSFIFTGYLFNNYSIGFREEFDKICKTYGIPIGLFAKDVYGINKVLKIFDYIVKQKNIKPGGKETFTEFLYGTDDPDSIDVMSIRSKSKRSEIIQQLENFWILHGESIVSSLDYTDITLLEGTDSSEKEVVNEYFEKVNDPITEDFSFNNDLGKTAYAPYYQNGIFNVPTGAFQRIALELDEGSFHGKNKSIAEGVWNGIELKLEGIQDSMSNDKTYAFIIKKFINWFGRFYSGDSENKLIQALQSGDSDKIYNIIVNYNIENYGDNGKIPPEMSNGLKKFAKCFEKRPKNIDNILIDAFGKSKIEGIKYNIANNPTYKPDDLDLSAA